MMNKIISIFLLLTISLNTDKLQAENLWEGVPLAQFNLQDQNGKLTSNKDFLGQWLVLYFYPKDKTPGCTIEAQNFTDDYAKYQMLNTNIVGVSYDDVESHKDFSDTYEMPFTLLADVDKKLSKQMKVDKLFPWPHASRQTFIVDPEGKIAKHYPDVSPKTHSQQVLSQLKRLQAKAKAKAKAKEKEK